MKKTHAVYNEACNLVDMIAQRWSESIGGKNAEQMTALSYGILVRNIANDMRKIEIYENNISFVRKLASNSDDLEMDLFQELPEDLSDLFSNFDEDGLEEL